MTDRSFATRGRRLGLVIIVDAESGFCSKEGIRNLHSWKTDVTVIRLHGNGRKNSGIEIDSVSLPKGFSGSLKSHLFFLFLRPRRYAGIISHHFFGSGNGLKNKIKTLKRLDTAVKCAMSLRRNRFHEIHGTLEGDSGMVAFIASRLLEKTFSISSSLTMEKVRNEIRNPASGAEIPERDLILTAEMVVEARQVGVWQKGGRQAVGELLGEETIPFVAEPDFSSLEGGNTDRTDTVFMTMAVVFWPDYFADGGRTSHPLHVAFEIDQMHTYWLSIAWAPHSRRCEMFAREFRTRHYLIHYLKFKSPIYAPFKYILQAVRTMHVLLMERPDAVHTQNPPFFCGLIVYIYSLMTGAVFVLDHHSAAFARRWDFGLPLVRFLARQAITNIVTNKHWSSIIRSWGAHALIMGDAFLALPEGEPYPVRDEGFNLCYTCTFSPDEPVEEVVKAAAELPDVTFYITGESDRLPRELEGNLTDNIILTGFLPDNRFFGLLRSVDGIMSLTTRDFTLQQGGCEAVSVGKPFITSDWPYLREFFPEGTVYVKPTVSSISDGVRRLVEDRERLEKEMIRFREKGRRDWEIQFVRLFNMVAKARS